MRSLWSPAGVRALRAAFDVHTLVGFDFDGTLAPIVRNAGAARMRRLTRNRLTQLAKQVPCAVVSGRSLADLEPRVRGIPLAAVIGSHGIEPFFGTARLAARAHNWRGLVGAELAALAEARLEHKPYGMTVHYRGARDPRHVRRHTRRILEQLADARVIWGNAVADVVPLGAPTKGEGVDLARRTARARHVIYIGDDTTDEDVFGIGGALDWLTIRVGRRADSHARYFIRNQSEIDRVLLVMNELLSA